MIRRFGRNSLPGLACILFLAACSSQPRVVSGPDVRHDLYRARLDNLEKITDWSLEGRLAVNDGKDGGSGHFNWVQEDGANHMDFHGALGRGAWRLNADQKEAVLELANGEVYRARTVGELVFRQLGWKVPVEPLKYWVRGLQAPGQSETLELDEQGLPEKLSQFGWEIEFDRYRESMGTAMPGKMTARRDNQTVKLVVRNWALGPGGGDK